MDDLKQFIASTVSQSEARLTGRITGVEAKLTSRIDGLEKKVDDGFAGVGEAINVIHDQLDDFDLRLTEFKQAA